MSDTTAPLSSTTLPSCTTSDSPGFIQLKPINIWLYSMSSLFTPNSLSFLHSHFLLVNYKIIYKELMSYALNHLSSCFCAPSPCLMCPLKKPHCFALSRDCHRLHRPIGFWSGLWLGQGQGHDIPPCKWPRPRCQVLQVTDLSWFSEVSRQRLRRQEKGGSGQI